MKILFLCGGLAAGRDGVGDYSRILASAAIERGHTVGLLALNDKYESEETKDLIQINGSALTIVRLPGCWKNKEKFKRAAEIVDAFNPDWLSLQFVIFSFHPKGLPLLLEQHLKQIGKGRSWHIMFHEIWLGIEKEASLKIRLWGLAQKLLIIRLVRKLAPVMMHTQSSLHLAALQHSNINARLLPLLSNIPVTHKKNTGSSTAVKPVLTFVIFGSVYFGAPIEDFAEEAALFAKNAQTRIKFLMIGHNRNKSDNWIKKCKLVEIEVEQLGEQPPERISEVLSNATYGISTTPLFLLEKSGTVMAMLEHGLTVICVARPYLPRIDVQTPGLPGVREYIKGNLNFCLAPAITDRTSDNSAPEIARQFIASLFPDN